MRQQDITYQDKLNELKLDISHPHSKGKVFVLLEGESDVRLFRKLFNPSNCKVETVPGGKFKVEDCVQALIADYSLVLGIRDADFIHIEKAPYNKANIFLTDVHDMEMMIFSEDELFSALISEHTHLAADQHLEIRDAILNSIKQIGYLMWLNEKGDLKYNFNIGFVDLLSFTNPHIDFRQYFSRLLNKSPNATIIDVTDVLNRIALLQQTNPDLFQLCNGHDFQTAFSQYLRQVHNANNVNEKNIGSSCRIAYTSNHYQKSMLFRNTQKWADDNHCVIY